MEVVKFVFCNVKFKFLQERRSWKYYFNLDM